MNKPQRQASIDTLDWPWLHNMRTRILACLKDSKAKQKGLESDTKYRDQFTYTNGVIAKRIQTKANFRDNPDRWKQS